jgi:hypothetical protein
MGAVRILEEMMRRKNCGKIIADRHKISIPKATYFNVHSLGIAVDCGQEICVSSLESLVDVSTEEPIQEQIKQEQMQDLTQEIIATGCVTVRAEHVMEDPSFSSPPLVSEIPIRMLQPALEKRNGPFIRELKEVKENPPTRRSGRHIIQTLEELRRKHFSIKDERVNAMKTRKRATPEQINTLETYYYTVSKFPPKEVRMELHYRTGMDIRRIQIWFQNRRARERKEEKMRPKTIVQVWNEQF